MKRIPRDFWVSVVMLAGAILYWLEADDIPISPLDGEVNAAAMPKMLAFILAFLAVLLMVQALIKALRRPRDKPPTGEEGQKVTTWREHARALGLVALGAAYLALLPVLGYWLSVAGLIAAIAFYMGAPLGTRLVVIAAGVAVCFQLLFVQVLHIQLPAGALAEFLF